MDYQQLPNWRKYVLIYQEQIDGFRLQSSEEWYQERYEADKSVFFSSIGLTVTMERV